MTTRLSRRALLAGMAAAFVPVSEAASDLAEIERRLGGRLGVAAVDTGSGRRLEHRPSERFAMCSIFKFLAAAAVLARVDAKTERLDRLVRYSRKDVLEYAPIAKGHVDHGMTIEALCAAAIEYSDNTAGNLLLRALGGPQAVTAFARRLGDRVTRLDRIEPYLNEVPAGEVRDTTSPASMAHDVRALLVDATVLSESSRGLLTKWMVGNTTGDQRLRAGLPGDWKVGDKTGTGPHGATNDVAITWPPGRPAVIISAFFWGSNAPQSDLNRALADVASVVTRWAFHPQAQRLRHGTGIGLEIRRRSA